MKFKLENIFKNEIEDKWDMYIDNLIEEYGLCVEHREIDGHRVELWCYDADLEALFYDFNIDIGNQRYNIQKEFDYDDNYEPSGLNYGDYIETIELIQYGNIYYVPVYCAHNGYGADYGIAIFEARKEYVYDKQIT